jgi:hypothetical protein
MASDAFALLCRQGTEDADVSALCNDFLEHVKLNNLSEMLNQR